MAVHGSLACATVLAAALAHAGANVLNDYYDALNGTDAANEARVSPFTGGSRMIQNGALGLNATRRLAYSLFLPVVPLGMFISWQVGPGLLWSVLSALVLLPMALSGAAAYDLFRYAHHPQYLRRAIVQTIAANHLLGGEGVMCLLH